MAQWLARVSASAPTTISVYVSRAELALGGRLLEQLRATLNRNQLPAQCMQLEVIDAEIMRHTEAAHALMLELQK